MSIIFTTKADVGDKFHMKATVKEYSDCTVAMSDSEIKHLAEYFKSGT